MIREPAGAYSDSGSSPERREIYCECELVSKKRSSRKSGVCPCSVLRNCRNERGPVWSLPGRILLDPPNCASIRKGENPRRDRAFGPEAFPGRALKGTRPVLWGPQLREEQLIQALYAELFNLDHFEDRKERKVGCVSRTHRPQA